MKCCLCKKEIEEHRTPEGKVYWTNSHNAQPIMDGRCCDSCNEGLVIPIRMIGTIKEMEKDNEV